MAKDVVVGDGTTEKSASEVWIGTTGGNKQATEVWVGTATGNKQVWPSLTAPAAPTGVSATEIDYDTIRVEWNLSATATGYRVFRSNDGSTGWAQVGGDLGPTIDLYDDNGLPEGVQRYYKVRAFNDAGESPDSTIVNNWTTLRAPTLLSLAAGTPAWSEINTNHNDGGCTAETQIRCYVSTTGSGSGFSLYETFAANSTSGIIDNLPEYTTHWVKLANYKSGYGGSGAGGGLSAYSTVLSRATGLAPIAAPTWNTVTAVCTPDDGYQLQWYDNSNNEDGFTIYRRVFGDDVWVVRTNQPANTTSWNDYTGYSSTSNYEWAIRSYRNTPTYQESSLAEYTGSNGIPDPPTAGVPGTPTDEGFNEIQVPFSGGTGATGWKIRRREGTAGSGTEIESNYTGPSPYQAGGFLPDQGDGAPSNVNIINIQTNQFQVSWTEHPTNPGDQLVLDLKEGTGSWQLNHQTGLTSSPTTVTGLSPGTQYSVRMRYRSQNADPYSWKFEPFNSCGTNTSGSWSSGLTPWEYAAYSNTDTDTTQTVSPPAAPTLPEITKVGTDDARYDWQDNSTNEDQFRVEYDINFSGWTFLVNKAPNVEFHVHNNIPGIQTGDDLQFRVRAENTGGNSSWAVSDPYIW